MERVFESAYKQINYINNEQQQAELYFTICRTCMHNYDQCDTVRHGPRKVVIFEF